MRELTLLETAYLSGLLLLSVVLPLLMSICGPPDPAARKSCTRTVWIGQALGAVAGLGMLVSASVAPYAAALGLMSCIGCSVVLLSHFRAASPASCEQREPN